jgi:hypothetical protein
LPPDAGPTRQDEAVRVSRYLLQHRHAAGECGAVFASFKGHASPLRHRAALSSCASGGHAIWWAVQARDEREALALLPFYVAERTTVTQVGSVRIP